MYCLQKRDQYLVRGETPDPLFARQFQQAIGGSDGEIRVCPSILIPAWNARGTEPRSRHAPPRCGGGDQPYRDARDRSRSSLEDAPHTVQESAAPQISKLRDLKLRSRPGEEVSADRLNLMNEAPVAPANT
jgi:Mn-containing catalase